MKANQALKIIQSFNESTEGIEYLRDALDWLNRQDESDHENRNPIQLLCDFEKIRQNWIK